MNNKGFTLIEMLIVVVIIGILVTVALPQYKKAVEKSRATEALIFLDSLDKAEDAHQLVTGRFTADLEALDITLPQQQQEEEEIIHLR